MTAQPKLIEGEVMAPKPKAVAKARAKTEVAVANEPSTLGSPALAMIERIMKDPTLSMERVNQAFDFYKRLEDDAARKAFNAAMADAKGEFTPIVKTHLVEYTNKSNETTAYKHEDLGDISDIVDPILGRHGLSYYYDGSSNPNEPISVTCIITHRQGWSKETTLKAGADSSGGKNSIQAIGSSLTYLQRYTLRLALGLATKRDDDGRAADAVVNAVIGEKQVEQLQALVVDAGADIRKFYEWLGVEKLQDIPVSKFADAVAKLEAKRKKQS